MSNLPPPKPKPIRNQKAFFRLGDVFMHAGCEYFVEMVSESRVRCQPLTKVKQVKFRMVKRDGKWREECVESMEYGPGNVSLSPTYWTADTQILRKHKFLGKSNASSAKVVEPEAEQTDNDTMKKKDAKTPKAKTPKVKAAPKVDRDKRVYTGRSAMIHELHAKGLKKDEILAKVKEHFPDTTPKVIKDVTACKPRSLAATPPPKKGKKAKAAAAPAKKAKATPPPKAKAPKAPPAKSTPPAKPAPVEPQEPAGEVVEAGAGFAPQQCPYAD